MIKALEANNEQDDIKVRYQDEKSQRSVRSLTIKVDPIKQMKVVTARNSNAPSMLEDDLFNHGTISVKKQSFFTKDNDALTQFLGKTL